MRLVPRQLRRGDFPSSVPYYGGRLTPGVIAGLGPTSAASASLPPPMPVANQPLPEADTSRLLAALNDLRDHGVLTPAEYAGLRTRIVGTM
jgi:hypothetical protein